MGNKKSDIDKNIQILLSVSDTEKNYLTPRQRELVDLLGNGIRPADLPQKMGCSRANSYLILKSCAEKIEKIRSGFSTPSIRQEGLRASNSRICHEKYRDYDMSALSRREAEVLELKINNPHITLQGIADFLGTSPQTCGVQLHNAIRKLEGNYNSRKDYQKEYRKRMSEEAKEKARAARKRHYQAHKEYHKEYQRKWREENREKVQKDEKERNKKYYQQHREEIIRKTRERRMNRKINKQEETKIDS